MIESKGQIEQLEFNELRDLIRKSGDSNITADEDWLIGIARFHKNDAIRRSAIVALRKIRSEKARPILISLLMTEFTNQNLRESAIKALGEIGNDETVRVLTELAESETISMFGRQAARKALARLYMALANKNKTRTYKAFISYSSRDKEFAQLLYRDLQSEGVRCWFAPEDLKIGEKFRQRIDESIHAHDKLLLILSESSISSVWVEEEVETAMERERRENRLVLFPIRIDDAVMHSDRAWAASLRRQRHIGDFAAWKDQEAYRMAFTHLVRDLTIEELPLSRA